MIFTQALSENVLTSLSIMIVPFLYAETHYRFKYFFSYLRKKEPELIIDIPLRVKKGRPFPVLLIVKDADKYPVIIQSIKVIENDHILEKFWLDRKIEDSYFDEIYTFPTHNLPSGFHPFSVKIDYKIGNKQKSCVADNHRGTSHQPLGTYISDDPLPRLEDCLYGETHFHSNYTSDQVEFGASLAATASMASSMDLDFCCATDHSYDLDDREDNYLLNDPDLNKWRKFRAEVHELNKQNGHALIIPGEEVSVRNSKKENVHLLVLDSEVFLPGSGDSGEKWFKNYSELSIPEIIESVPQQSLCFAAHPAESPPLLQKIFIRRGEWYPEDCRQPGLAGLQFINGGEKKYKEKGLKLWTDQLLDGYRLIGLAGNDAHGNFSRFRQIGFPFFTMREHDLHLFGRWRTGVFMEGKNKSVTNILEQMAKGNCFLTNGPALQLRLFTAGRQYLMGSDCRSPQQLQLTFGSSAEFAAIEHVRIYMGDITQKKEILIFRESYSGDNFEGEVVTDLSGLPAQGYIRSEVTTYAGHEALSNPIWFG